MSHFTETLSSLTTACEAVIDSYWKLHYQFRRYDYAITIPLIVASGFASISAMSQLLGERLPIQIITVVLTIMVTILASCQKYLEFDKRSITAKQVAKRWGSLKAKIDFFILGITTIDDHAAIIMIVNSIFHEIDAIGGTVEDIPDSKLVIDKLNNIKSVLTTERSHM